jgi:hypothetical protein
MAQISAGEYNVSELSFEEMKTITGGHKGTAYNVGHAIGKAIVTAAEAIGVLAFIFLAPKA